MYLLLVEAGDVVRAVVNLQPRRGQEEPRLGVFFDLIPLWCPLELLCGSELFPHHIEVRVEPLFGETSTEIRLQT